MNKQELIEEIKSLKYYNASKRPWVDRGLVLDLVEKLDEPQKPVVPKFVADWYEEHKDDFDYRVWECIYHDGEGEQTEMSEWICQNENAIITLVNMHQFGYTVEKEKRYIVKVKGVDSRTNYLYYGVGSKTWLFKAKLIDGHFRKSHTRKELEQDNFGWVFDCPGIEIEEVE